VEAFGGGGGVNIRALEAVCLILYFGALIMIVRLIAKGVLVAGLAGLTGSTGVGSASAAPVDFVHEVVPILRQHCGECHTGTKLKGGFSLNDRAALLHGSENGKVVVPGNSATSRLIELVESKDSDDWMPPKGPRVPPEQIAVLRKWVDAGVPWDEGFTFQKPSYEPPLKPRRPSLPAASSRGRTNPVDRILDASLAKSRQKLPGPIDDATFARRVSLDLIGLLPPPDALERFLNDRSRDKRTRLVQSLLTNDTAYAEHWLTFWNDLLRNDYAGTGYIDGGRKQISAWLYRALIENKPYDQFARELVAPVAESEGFARGIKWRGNVSAGQAVPVQFAQSVGQTFLGLNLKCASCHDSFIDRWKLEESYGLAAVYAEEPLELHRCDKPMGRKAKAAWLFPELGQINPDAPRPERLRQLAALLTHPDNGRLTRTMVNRLWHRLMGRAIVHPVDAMQAEPWNADLLDYLGVHLSDHRYDLKKTLELICTSAAYQSQTQSVGRDTDEKGYVYAGPRARRLTAEQFVDAIWQIGGIAPTKMDAPVQRGRIDPAEAKRSSLQGKWVWANAHADGAVPKGQVFSLQRTFTLAAAPREAGAVVSVDNSYTLFVNGTRVKTGDNWERPDSFELTSHLRLGTNRILLVARNGGDGPNPAAAFLEARIKMPDGTEEVIATDDRWDGVLAEPDGKGVFKDPPAWRPATVVSNQLWTARVGPELKAGMVRSLHRERMPVRASLVKSDLLMRTLGRPNREQIVSTRPNDLTTLEAIDLANGPGLASMLERAAKNVVAREWKSADDLVQWLYRSALSRPATKAELALARETVGTPVAAEGVQDLLWVLVMLPEFQLIR
jgi:mono/diheme cytochrome c family protein